MKAIIRPATATLAILLLAALMILLPSGNARASAVPRHAIAYGWALTQAGCWYSWGGTSCSPGFDCSGLVMEAYAHAGIWLPRTTYGMLADPRLHRVWRPHPGELAFYGTGHVELYAGGNVTFGAHDFGTRVGFITEWMTPAFYYVWGSLSSAAI